MSSNYKMQKKRTLTIDPGFDIRLTFAVYFSFSYLGLQHSKLLHSLEK